MRARTIFVAGLLTAPALPALAATIYPNACLPTVVAPCYIANLSGPLLITDPAQVTFTITLTTLAGLTGNTALTTAFYTDPNGMLAADPTPIVQQSQNATAALVGAGNAPIAPNPGGAVVVTNSVTSLSSGFVDTPVTQRVDDYSTTIEAVLNGGSTVYTQTFSAPFGDHSVQAAIAAAGAILSGDGATFGAPQQTSSMTSITGSQLTFQVTGQTPTGAQEVSTETVFGPAFLAVGDELTDLFTVIAGQTEINVNTENSYATDRNAITTNTFLTSQTYEIDGTTTQSSAAPEPWSWALLGCGGVLLAAIRRKLIA